VGAYVYIVGKIIEMPKVVYLLGAGVSYDSIPVVERFVEEIEGILIILRGMVITNKMVFASNGKILLDTAIEDLLFLQAGCIDHRSVDTFAKKLFLTSHILENRYNYARLKNSVVLFFELYRFFHKKVDKRYDGFIATLLNNTPTRFPSDVNILSWNYDYEFERAYHKYCPEKQHLEEVYNDINFVHKNHKKTVSNKGLFSVLKINGTAGFFDSNHKLILGLGYPDLMGSSAENWHAEVFPILEKYLEYCLPENGYSSAISFSWESDNGEQKILKRIENCIFNAEKLVIIGYSFPYFNRQIDRFIVNTIKHDKIKVYIQDPLSDELVEVLQELKQWPLNAIKPIRNCKQYYMDI